VIAPLHRLADLLGVALALGDVGGDAGHRVGVALLVAQREFHGEEGARLAVHRHDLLRLHRLPRLQTAPLAHPQGVGHGHGEEVVVGLPHDLVAGQPHQLVALPPGHDVAAAGILHPHEGG
jgi:hypothetical protein